MMEDFAVPFLLSVFWATVGCATLRMTFKAPFNLLCGAWTGMVFAGTLVLVGIFSVLQVKWPVGLPLSAMLLPATMIFFRVNLAKHVASNSSEPVWGPFVFGGLLVAAAAAIAFQKSFFRSLLVHAQDSMTFAGAMSMYLFMVLTVGLIGVMAILSVRYKK